MGHTTYVLLTETAYSTPIQTFEIPTSVPMIVFKDVSSKWSNIPPFLFSHQNPHLSLAQIPNLHQPVPISIDQIYSFFTEIITVCSVRSSLEIYFPTHVWICRGQVSMATWHNKHNAQHAEIIQYLQNYNALYCVYTIEKMQNRRKYWVIMNKTYLVNLFWIDRNGISDYACE